MNDFLPVTSNDYFGKETRCHYNKRATKAATPCQHFHVYVNGTTRNEERKIWRISCLTFFVMVVIAIVLLNCFNYYYRIGLYYVKNESSEHSDMSYDDAGTVAANRENERLLYSKMVAQNP